MDGEFFFIRVVFYVFGSGTIVKPIPFVSYRFLLKYCPLVADEWKAYISSRIFFGIILHLLH